LPGLAIGGDEFGGQYGGEQLDRRTQATQSDASLVDEFRFAASQQPWFVALELFEAAQRDAAKCLERRLAGVDGHQSGLEGAGRFVEKELVATLGLAGDGRVQVDVVLQSAGQAKNVVNLAGE
jgi:hypothetical protein